MQVAALFGQWRLAGQEGQLFPARPALFSSHQKVTLPANARITMTFQVEYGSGDVTAVNRLLTWTRDTVVVETNEETHSVLTRP